MAPAEQEEELHIIVRASGEAARSFYGGQGFRPTASFGKAFTAHVAEVDMIFTFSPEILHIGLINSKLI